MVETPSYTRREQATLRRLQARFAALGREQQRAFRAYTRACLRTPERRQYDNLLRATVRAGKRIGAYMAECSARRQQGVAGV